MRFWIILALGGALLGMCGCDRGPQIDPKHVVALDALMPMAMNVLEYEDADARGWPVGKEERAYIAFLQSKGVNLAFAQLEKNHYSAVVGVKDAWRMNQLNKEAAEAKTPPPAKAPSSSSGTKLDSSIPEGR
ncbi:MAG: hypothetical protein NTW19_16045 [Planctomycetota bacterium]|nr:hypothetical protein [Planctomycetota bacterium]